MNRPLKSGYHANIKANLKSLLGSSIARFNRSRAIGNFRRPSVNCSRIDDLILDYLRKRCTLEERNGFLERLHAAYWQGETSREYYDSKTNEWKIFKAISGIKEGRQDKLPVNC